MNIMLERMIRTVEEEIASALPTPYLRSQAMGIASLLHNLLPRLEEKSELLDRENDELRKVLEGVMALLKGSHPRRRALREALEVRTGEVAPTPGEENQKLKEGVVELIQGLPELGLPPEQEAEIASLVRSQLRNQLDRELSLRHPTHFGRLSVG